MRLPIRPMLCSAILAVAVPARAAEEATDSGLTLTLRPDREGPALRWSLVGAQRVKARAGEREAHVYDEVYPGVRLTVEPRPPSLWYRFDVAPGVDPSAIRIRWDGAKVALDRDGGLRVVVGGGVLRERGLRCFQTRPARDVPCAYDLQRGEVSIHVGPYDRARPLVIDPEIGWSSYLGGSGEDIAYDMVADGAGNVYVTGSTLSPEFPSAGGFDSIVGGQDAFVARISSSGGLDWSTYLGGSSNDLGNAVAVDSADNVYVAGTTYSSNFPSTGGFQDTLEGTIDGFVAKIAAAGSSLVWGSYLGGSGEDRASGISVDGSGNAYVAGQTDSSNFPSTGGFDMALGGTRDAFVTKFDASGSSLAWSSYLGGSAADWGNDVRVTSLGDAVVVGATMSGDFPVMSGALGGIADAFVARVDASGSLVSAYFLGGDDEDYGLSLAMDSANGALVVGSTNSSDFPAADGFDTSINGAFDAFVAKIDVTGPGLLEWGSYLGGAGDDYGQDVAIAGADVVVFGSTLSANFPTAGGFDTVLGGTQDAFVARVAAEGSTLRWSSYLGGAGTEQGWGGTADGLETLYAAGQTSSLDFPVSGGFDTSYNNFIDSFVAQIGDSCSGSCGDGLCDSPCEDSTRCPADCAGGDGGPPSDAGNGAGPPPSGSASDGCGCRIGHSPRGAGLSALLVALLSLWRRPVRAKSEA